MIHRRPLHKVSDYKSTNLASGLGCLMAGETRQSYITNPRTSWRLYVTALAFSCLLVWGIERIVVTRGFDQFQEQTNRIASHLEVGRKKAMVLGSVITIGGLNPVVKATAKGLLPPDNPQISDLLARLDHEFGLGNVFVMNREGVIVAYQIESGKSGVGQNKSYRSYFRSAVAGMPNMYAALGTNTGKRGFYIAAPILENNFADPALSQVSATAPPPNRTAPPTPDIIGAFVAKLGFEEVDDLLEKESDPYAVVSPEGVVFATNVGRWQYQVIGTEKNLELAMHDKRTSKAFEKQPPRRLAQDEQGWLREGGRKLKTISADLDWKDPKGSWHLVGFADPSSSFGIPGRLAVGSMGFLFFVLLGRLWLVQRRVVERTAELKVANQKLKTLSTTDALTNLANRRHFDNALLKEWSRAKRDRRPLSLMMIDADDFKKYNDHYGHQAGDACLRRIAHALQARVRRPGDLAARYGGEEFSVVLADTDSAAAHRLAEGIRCFVEALNIPHELSSTGKVTVSIGVAVMASGKSQAVESLLQSADEALYRAKKDGRNRVVLAAEDAKSIQGDGEIE